MTLSAPTESCRGLPVEAAPPVGRISILVVQPDAISHLPLRLVEAAKRSREFVFTTARLADAVGLETVIARTEPDVVLFTGWPSARLADAARICRGHDLPILYYADFSFAQASEAVTSWVERFRVRHFLWQCTAFLSVGDRPREALHYFGVTAERIFTVPDLLEHDVLAGERNAATPRDVRAAMGLKADAPLVLVLGEVEDHRVLADLVRAVRATDPTAQLILAGMRSPAPHADAESLGDLSAERRREVYLAADYVIVRRTVASTTWTPYEAMFLGRPCVISEDNTSATDLVVNGETGALFDATDSTSLATAIETLRVKQAGGFQFEPQCRERAARYFAPDVHMGLVSAFRAARASRRGEKPLESPHRVLACFGASVVIAGLELATFDMLRAMTHSCARVHCVVNEWENMRLTPLVEDVGATWSTGTYGYRLDRSMLTFGGLIGTLGKILRTSAELLRDVWRFRPTHIFLAEQISVIRNAPALLLVRLFGVRVVLRLHNAPDPSAFHKRFWRHGIARLVDYFVPNSEFTRQEILALGIRIESVTAVVYPTSAAAWKDRQEEPRRDFGKILYVGQTIPEKGAHLLLEAVAELVRQGQDVRLDIVGPIDGWEQPKHRGYRQSLVERASKPDLASRVRFLGYLPNVLPILSTAGIHCCPSLPAQREAFGRVTVEAKLAGVPTVAFPLGALPELITQDEDGWICSEVSVKSLSDGLARFLNKPERIKRMGAAAHASAARFLTSDVQWMLILDQTRTSSRAH
jgi:glycosyltransferase involved in cell wall biosynthesis